MIYFLTAAYGRERSNKMSEEEDNSKSGTSEFEKQRLMQIPKVGAKAADALYSNGYTLEKLATAVPNDIAKILSVKPMKAREVIINAQTVLSHDTPPPSLASSYEEEQKSRVQWIKFINAPGLNKILGGGFKTSATAGLSGPQASGKSQMCNDLILYVTNDMEKDPDNNPEVCKDAAVMMFETELNTYSPDRLREMAQATGREYKPDRIIIVPATRIRDVGTQYYQYQKAYELAKAMNMNIKLIIVDSLTALFQRKYTGRETLPDRKQEMGRHLSFLEDMAKEFNALVVCTCQVIESPVSPMEARGAFNQADVKTQFGSNYMTWGGHILRHTLGTWISCYHLGKDMWAFVIFDSSELPSAKRLFMINNKGVCDCEDAKSNDAGKIQVT